MAGNWQIFPPWSAHEQGPVDVSPGSLIREDYRIVEHATETETMISFCWANLSRQEVANLRNLISSEELKALLLTYNYGISWGAGVDMVSNEDPHDAECDFTIHSNQGIPETCLIDLVHFIRHYRVH